MNDSPIDDELAARMRKSYGVELTDEEEMVLNGIRDYFQDSLERCSGFSAIVEAVAQNSLGVRYDNGEGVPKDDVAGYAWFSVAAASGDEGARKNRDIIKRSLTPAQLEKGKVLAREISERITKRNAAETHYE